LVRVGVASVAAGSAGLTLAFTLCAWMLQVGEPADAAARASAPGVSVFGTIHPQLPSYGAAASVTRLETTFASRFAPMAPDNKADAPTTTASLPSSSFDDRFSFRQAVPPTRSLRPSMSFSDRFAGAIASGTPPAQFAMLDPRPMMTPVAPVTPAAPTPEPAAASAPAAPHAAARAALAARVAAPKRQPAGTYQVASLGDTPIRTAYASVDSASRDPGMDDSLLKKMTPRDPAPKDAATGPDMSRTAIYDITAHVVYLPNGKRLEAHSGLGEHMDDLGAVNLRSLGPTPPGLYDLTMRESRFHGIEAIRLNPVDNGKMYGRAGILAHPYMLGPNGQSNGCVSLKDYDDFLAAFKRGEFNRIMVVERLDDAPGGGTTATGWIADKIRGLFGRS